MSKITRIDFSDEGHRVLVADDSPSVRAMPVAELIEMGLETTDAANGVEVLNAIILDPKGYSIVICDVEMPRLDGLPLSVNIRDGDAQDVTITCRLTSIFL